MARRTEFHAQLRPAMGSQHALVRHAEQDPDDRRRRAIHGVPRRAERLAGAWRPGIAGWRTDPIDAGPDHLAQLRTPSRPCLVAECLRRPTGQAIRRAWKDQHPGRRGHLLHRDPGRGSLHRGGGRSLRTVLGEPVARVCSTSRSLPARTAVHRLSASRSCCPCRDPPASRIWTGPCSCRSPVRPDISRATSSRTASTSISPFRRELSSSTVLTLAYVGTEGHKLFAQYEANPGDAALCLSLRGTGVKVGIAPMRTQSGERDIYPAGRLASFRDSRSARVRFRQQYVRIHQCELLLQLLCRLQWNGAGGI